MIERVIRDRLRAEFQITLPRFDLMSQLARSPHGLKMNELSQLMMVTGGNVTGLTDQLEAEGLVKRSALANDRRAWRVQLTTRGRKTFSGMAQAHERWIAELLDASKPADQQSLYTALGGLKTAVQSKRVDVANRITTTKSP